MEETTAKLAALDEDDGPTLSLDDLPADTGLLVVARGPNAGSRFLLDQDVVRIGRHPDADILLDDVTVSRQHAEMRRRGEGFVVADAGSLNGTYLNRRRVEEAALHDGDELQIGKFRLVFHGNTSEVDVPA